MTFLLQSNSFFSKQLNIPFLPQSISISTKDFLIITFLLQSFSVLSKEFLDITFLLESNSVLSARVSAHECVCVLQFSASLGSDSTHSTDLIPVDYVILVLRLCRI